MMWESRESPFEKIDDWCLVRRIMLESVHVSFLVSEIETFHSKPWNSKGFLLIGRLNFFRSFQLNLCAKMRMLENSHHVPGPSPRSPIPPKISPTRWHWTAYHQNQSFPAPGRHLSPGHPSGSSPGITSTHLPMFTGRQCESLMAWQNRKFGFLFFVILFEGEPDGLCWNWRVLLVSFVNAWHLSSQILVCTAASDSTSTRLMYLVISYKGLSSGLLVCCILDGSVTRRKSTTFANSHSSIHLYTIDSCILPQ